jgi:colanic acid/amylovoran biosynthesis protein
MTHPVSEQARRGSRPVRIVIANQHGENRGDEAAMRAMLAAFTEELGDVEFTILYQFRDKELRLDFKERVTALPIIIPPIEALGLLAYAGARGLSIHPRRILGRTAAGIIRAYEEADLVVSAPGGPYFGDLYKNHEVVHWFFVWLAKQYGVPTLLYATSAGPFEDRRLNPIRRWLYPAFDVLCVREEISRDYIRNLLGGDAELHVTADSALQASVEPTPRGSYFSGDRSALARRFIVAVSLNDYAYPGASDVEASKRRYDDTMIAVLEHLAARRDVHYLLLPQLYGRVHSDAPYLERMGRRLSSGVSWELVDSSLDSDAQRGLFAMSDLHLASRYHPAIFGHSAGVPGVCIYYEHKALGFMRQLGLERFAFDIREVEVQPLCDAVDAVLESRETIRGELHARVPELRARARRTTTLAVELLTRTRAEAGRT